MSFKEHTIKAGKHASTPFAFDYSKVGYEEWTAYFHASAAHDLKNPNQQDFSKGPGRSFCFWTNHRDSFMLAWRWNLVSQLMELTSYYHIGGNRIMGPSGVLVEPYPDYPFRIVEPNNIYSTLGSIQPWEYKIYEKRIAGYHAAISAVQIMARVRLEEQFNIGLLKNPDKKEYGIAIRTDSGGWVRDTKRFSKDAKRSRLIKWYFGGDEVAPHDMRIYDKKVKEYDL